MVPGVDSNPPARRCAQLMAHGDREYHGALDTRQVGQSMILIAPHNPLPLLDEIEARTETFTVDYLKEGPGDWHLRLTRTA